MKINEVTLKDLKKILSLEREVFKENAFLKDLIEKLIKNNTFFLKLEIRKIKKYIIGFVIVIKDRKDKVNIINFVINPRYQNGGYGSFFLKKTIEKIKELDEINKIVLNVKINNRIAIRLYEKHQFRIVQTIENYYRQHESAYLMSLDLKPNKK